MNTQTQTTVQARPKAMLWVSVLLALVVVCLALSIGGAYRSPEIFWQLRLPRVLAAFGVGGLLALAGLLLQALLRNPLAEPYMLGAASGASFALLIGTVMGWAWWALQGLAFVGAVAVLTLIWWLLRRFTRLEGDISIVLLLGILLSALLNAGVNVLLLLMPERALRGALFWMMGDLAGAGQYYLAWCGVWLCLILALPLASKISALMRGALMAHAVGISVQKTRVQLLLLAGLATAIAVSEAGAVGFVGLVVPHFVKLFSARRGIDMRGVMLLCVLWGGVLLVLADGLARTLIAPMQLPVGVLTIALGAPFGVAIAHTHARQSCGRCAMNRLLQCQQLSIRVGQKQLIEPFDWQVNSGERWAVLGQNGVGKTALLHALLGVDARCHANVLLGGVSLSG